MTKYYYKKSSSKYLKKIVRLVSIGIFIFGILISFYIFSPLILWQVYFVPAFASQILTSPIPRSTVVNTYTIQNLVTSTANNLKGVDYTDARNWFPDFKSPQNLKGLSSYTLSIPKLLIKDSVVSTDDYDLSKHLVNYAGTAVPPNNGTAVIFGHSTLPQFFNPKDYKTIFATVYKLKAGDEIIVNVSGISYTYVVYNISVVEPDDISVFVQNYDDSYLTLVTCTPPGTTWKRLLTKAHLKSI